MPSIGIAILTLNAKKHLTACLTPWLNSPLRPHVLVVDSSSTDGTAEEAKRLGADTLVIPRKQFNHGTTRELARKHLGTDIVVMVTQDAYAVNEGVLEVLIAPIVQGKASISYARQIPHIGAGFFESFARSFNYPASSHIRSLRDIDKHGVYTFFCSNSCAAYSSSALDAIGGFSSVLTGEDTVAVGKLLQRGHAVAYTAEAEVFHSHNYTLKEEFKRMFDTGLARQSYQHLLKAPGGDTKRGVAFTQALLKTLARERPHLIPYALLQTGAKWLGYQVGKRSVQAPRRFKRAFSSQPYYWS